MHITEVSFDCNRQDTAGINCVASTQASGCEEREEAHGPVVSSTCNLSISINLLSKMTNAHHKLQEAVSQKLTGGLNTKFIYEDNEKSRLNQEISRCGSSQVTRHILTTCFYIKWNTCFLPTPLCNLCVKERFGIIWPSHKSFIEFKCTSKCIFWH